MGQLVPRFPPASAQQSGRCSAGCRSEAGTPRAGSYEAEPGTQSIDGSLNTYLRPLTSYLRQGERPNKSGQHREVMAAQWSGRDLNPRPWHCEFGDKQHRNPQNSRRFPRLYHRIQGLQSLLFGCSLSRVFAVLLESAGAESGSLPVVPPRVCMRVEARLRLTSRAQCDIPQESRP